MSITKHLKVRQKYPATRRIFKSLLGDWKFGQTRYFVFEYYEQNCPHTGSSLVNIFKVVHITDLFLSSNGR